MALVRSGQLIIGASLVAMGYALLVAAIVEQAQRAAAVAATDGSAFEATAAARTAVPQAATTPQPTATPPPSSTPPATPPASSAAAAEPTSESDVKLFKFSAGGAAMSRDEVQRLIAFGKVLARHPAAKVSIEGFGDRPGSEALMVGIAKHRAKVAQMLLAKAGVTEDRVTISFVDMGADQRLAQTIRVTTMPPLSEIEKP